MITMIEIMSSFPRYKYVLEESYEFEDKKLREENLDYYIILKCKHGDISKKDTNNLQVITGKEKRIINRFLAIPGSKIVANGDEETVITFPTEAFKLAKKVAKPYLNDTEKAKVAERLHKGATKTDEPKAEKIDS